jgi:hypothetical protein
MRGWVLFMVVAGAACTKERGKPAPLVDAAASSTAWRLEDVPKDLMPPPEPKVDTLPHSWTDPAVVRRLTGDCAYSPRRFEDEPGFIGDLGTNRFSCSRGSEFPGSPRRSDVCQPYADACELQCRTSCDTCDAVCTGACTKCKTPCADDACRTACATTCAECKESCSTKWERCDPDCSKTREACTTRLAAQWDRNDCATKCATWKTCTDACASTDGVCTEKCERTLAPTLGACAKKCEYIATFEEHEVCDLKCSESVPCAPALCKSPPRR